MTFQSLLKNLRYRFLILFCMLDHAVLAIITLGNCKPYEQISSCAWGLEKDGRVLGIIFRPIIDTLLRPLQKDHCLKIWVTEQRQIILMTGLK